MARFYAPSRTRIRGKPRIPCGIRRGGMQSFAHYPDARVSTQTFILGCDSAHMYMFIADYPLHSEGIELRSRARCWIATRKCVRSDREICGGVGLLPVKSSSGSWSYACGTRNQCRSHSRTKPSADLSTLPKPDSPSSRFLDEFRHRGAISQLHLHGSAEPLFARSRMLG